MPLQLETPLERLKQVDGKLDGDHDLLVLSRPQPIDQSINHITFGDLHGNALKFIHQLIQTGFISGINKDQYKRLTDIYMTETKELTIENLREFAEILKNATVHDQRSLTLIGDELADRGNNDYLTLLVMKRLHTGGVDFDITISNHSIEFIRTLSGSTKELLANANNQANSLVQYNILIKRFPEIQKHTVEIYRDIYTQRLKAISYSFDPEKKQISLYAHAPIDMNIVQALCVKFKTHFDMSSAEKLMESIDQLNEKISLAVKENKCQSLFKFDKSGNMMDMEDPFIKLIWNRSLFDKEANFQPPKDAGYSILFVHGHVGIVSLSFSDYHLNIDNNFGKSKDHNQASVLYDASRSLSKNQVSRQLVSNKLTEISKIKEFKGYVAFLQELLTSNLTTTVLVDISNTCDDLLSIHDYSKQVKNLTQHDLSTYIEKHVGIPRNDAPTAHLPGPKKIAALALACKDIYTQLESAKQELERLENGFYFNKESKIAAIKAAIQNPDFDSLKNENNALTKALNMNRLPWKKEVTESFKNYKRAVGDLQKEEKPDINPEPDISQKTNFL